MVRTMQTETGRQPRLGVKSKTHKFRWKLEKLAALFDGLKQTIDWLRTGIGPLMLPTVACDRD